MARAIRTWGDLKRELEERGVRDDMLIGHIEIVSILLNGVERVEFDSNGAETMFWVR